MVDEGEILEDDGAIFAGCGGCSDGIDGCTVAGEELGWWGRFVGLIVELIRGRISCTCHGGIQI